MGSSYNNCIWPHQTLQAFKHKAQCQIWIAYLPTDKRTSREIQLNTQAKKNEVLCSTYKRKQNLPK